MDISINHKGPTFVSVEIKAGLGHFGHVLSQGEADFSNEQLTDRLSLRPYIILMKPER